MSEWKPIETAPKDGTTVRVHHSLAGDFYDCDGSYLEGVWQLPHYFVFSDGYHSFMSAEPTHWKPLNPIIG
jgi:hypothetical protein